MFGSTVAFTLPTGNPSFPEIPEDGLFLPKRDPLGIKMGYEGDYCFDGKLDIKRPKKGLNRDIRRYRYHYHLAKLTFNVIDRVEAYAGIGVMQQSLRFSPLENLNCSLDTDHQFAWQLGGRALLIYWKNTAFGLDAKYMRSPPSIEVLKVNGTSISPKGGDLRYHAWQVGGGLSHRIRWFIPYGGISFFETKVKLRKLPAIKGDNFPSKLILMDRKRVIVFLGATFTSDRFFLFTVEGRFLAEEGISAMADLRF